MKLLGYIRRSQDSGAGVSEELQREKIEQWAALYEHEIQWLPPDLDESSRTLERPSMQKALGLLADGKAEGIVAAYQSRLTRDPAHWSQLVNLASKQGWNLCCVDTKFDLASPAGRLMAGVMAQFDGYEYEVKKEGMDDGRRNAVLVHGVHGGNEPPLGYEFTERGRGKAGRVLRGPLKKNADAPKVLAAFEARAEGKSWKTVVGILGVKSQGNAAAIIANRCYLGEARSGDFVKEKAHPPIVSEEVFRRAQRKQTVRSDTATRREGALLALVCRCQTCGHALTYDASAVKPIYRCKYLLCSRRAAVQAASIEGYVFHQALVWHAVLGSMYEDTIEVAVFEEELAKAQAVVAELDAALDAKEIDATSYGKAATAARVVAAGAATALADAEASNGWLGMNTDAVQRRLLADGLVPVEDGIPRPVCKDIPAGRDFCQQMVRVIVRPVGRGKRVPVADRVDVECLTPVGVAQPEVLAV